MTLMCNLDVKFIDSSRFDLLIFMYPYAAVRRAVAHVLVSIVHCVDAVAKPLLGMSIV